MARDKPFNPINPVASSIGPDAPIDRELGYPMRQNPGAYSQLVNGGVVVLAPSAEFDQQTPPNPAQALPTTPTGPAILPPPPPFGR